jgi:protein SCO1/2
MEKPTRAVEWVVWAVLGGALVGFMGLFLAGRLGRQSPPAPVYGEVKDFSLTNQASQRVSLEDLKGKVWIADIIFTRCPGPCLRMTREMRKLQQALPSDGSVWLVSLTADPAFDTPTELARYGTRQGADFRNWHFLHGSKSSLYDLAIRGLLLAVEEKGEAERESEADLFIHSTRFAVIDKRGRIRGMFDGTEAASTAAAKSLVEALLRERGSGS